MTSSSPRGSRKGRFFALPQSPQIYKQLLVISGFERYYQIARCFRDEDLRADRLQELTQLDVEMAFPDYEYLFELIERMFARVWGECIGGRARDAVSPDDLGRRAAPLRLGQAGSPLQSRDRGRDRGDA